MIFCLCDIFCHLHEAHICVKIYGILKAFLMRKASVAARIGP